MCVCRCQVCYVYLTLQQRAIYRTDEHFYDAELVMSKIKQDYKYRCTIYLMLVHNWVISLAAIKIWHFNLLHFHVMKKKLSENFKVSVK